MKTTLIVASLTIVSFTSSFAADSTKSPKGQGQTLVQKKAEIAQHIEERIANSQLEKSCVQAAQSHDELQSCREKYRPQRPQQDKERRDRNQ
ncbi:hypothetical protein KI809_17240 [Geobacter pelophilus]|uniref:PsiF repeat-containing protein n=1 Tax=Geoanaerobacter pelophilus TaxID=60036 RepID=A0AAW4L880_9BACT|nr:hypothetical protein [Geoanaerobacter pelophilus]MBT0666060.1 hypothetical protein [Geoanaerobacter pelophilus]